MTNKILFALAATAVALPAAAQAQRVPAASIAVVDTNRIGAECTACRAAATRLQSQEATLRTRAQALQTQLATARRPIETAVSALAGKQPDAALQGRITAYQTQERAAQTELQNGQANLASSQANVNQQIGARMTTIVASIAATRGANVAVDKGSTLYSAATIDITNDVLAQLNQQLPTVTVTPLPAQANTQGR
jgi:outer membrane protein